MQCLFTKTDQDVNTSVIVKTDIGFVIIYLADTCLDKTVTDIKAEVDNIISRIKETAESIGVHYPQLLHNNKLIRVVHDLDSFNMNKSCVVDNQNQVTPSADIQNVTALPPNEESTQLQPPVQPQPPKPKSKLVPQILNGRPVSNNGSFRDDQIVKNPKTVSVPQGQIISRDVTPAELMGGSMSEAYDSPYGSESTIDPVTENVIPLVDIGGKKVSKQRVTTPSGAVFDVENKIVDQFGETVIAINTDFTSDDFDKMMKRKKDIEDQTSYKDGYYLRDCKKCINGVINGSPCPFCGGHGKV